MGEDIVPTCWVYLSFTLMCGCRYACSKIVMEYCGGGSLCDLMSICERTLSEDQIALGKLAKIMNFDVFFNRLVAEAIIPLSFTCSLLFFCVVCKIHSDEELLGGPGIPPQGKEDTQGHKIWQYFVNGKRGLQVGGFWGFGTTHCHI